MENFINDHIVAIIVTVLAGAILFPILSRCMKKAKHKSWMRCFSLLRWIVLTITIVLPALGFSIINNSNGALCAISLIVLLLIYDDLQEVRKI